MGVAVHSFGLNLRLVLEQTIEDVDRFVDAAGNEVTEQRNVGIRDVVVRVYATSIPKRTLTYYTSNRSCLS